MTTDRTLGDHDKFIELAAMATSGTLTTTESEDLRIHLEECTECRQVYREYRVLAREGFPLLATGYDHQEAGGSWDETGARTKLLTRIQAAEKQDSFGSNARAAAWVAVAACLLIGAAVGAYRLGHRAAIGEKKAATSADARVQELESEKKAVDRQLGAQTKKLDRLEAEGSLKEKEMQRIESDLESLKDQSSALRAAKTTSDQQLSYVSQQRDTLSQQLHDAQQAYQDVHTQLTNVRGERDKVVLRLASLEMAVNELSSTNHDLEKRVADDTQYLSSDRDIRELMGARNLYIADVFDVDSDSRTRKPYGRVFYTRGKSLIFYAFDLDRQRGIKNASTYQAWGQRETPQGEQAQPVNLGILYVDSEANRRWAVRCDDPAQLAELDAVFVTAEPNGGSPKPTNKPFLYAMLRKEANHP